MTLRVPARYLVAALLPGLIGGLAIWAAPMLPEARDLPDELVALGAIRRVHLEVRPLSDRLHEGGVREQAILDQVRPLLTDAGFEIIEGDATPRLRVIVEAGKDPGLPGIVSLAVFVDIVQKVHLERLDRTLIVPTGTVTHHSPKGSGPLDEAVSEMVETAIQSFIAMERLASGRD